jgi:hypothetical protein
MTAAIGQPATLLARADEVILDRHKPTFPENANISSERNPVRSSWLILRRKLLDAASSDNERGIAHDNLGTALTTLGERESGPARLEEAIVSRRAEGKDARARAARLGAAQLVRRRQRR